MRTHGGGSVASGAPSPGTPVACDGRLGLGLGTGLVGGQQPRPRPGRGGQLDHITSDAGYLSRSALAELGRAARPYAAMVQRGRPQSALPSSNGERYSHQASPPRIASPPRGRFFPLGRRPGWAGVFFTSNRFCVNCSWLLVRSLPGRCSQTHFPTWPRPEKERQTTLSGGSLGSCVD